MKSFLLAVLSLIAVLALGTTESCLLRVHAAAAKPYRVTISPPIAARTVNVKVDGKITIWSDALGFDSPKAEPLHTSAKLVQDPAKGIWTITMTNLSIPWDSSTVLTLQNGKVASGVFRPSTNAAILTIPLKGIPLINTLRHASNPLDSFVLVQGSHYQAESPPFDTCLTFSLSTDGSVTTTNKQTIRGRRVDQKGNITLIGSKSHIGFLNNQAQISIQSVLSPWPLRANPRSKKPS